MDVVLRTTEAVKPRTRGAGTSFRPRPAYSPKVSVMRARDDPRLGPVHEILDVEIAECEAAPHDHRPGTVTFGRHGQ
jgi:hypothetical protein